MRRPPSSLVVVTLLAVAASASVGCKGRDRAASGDPSAPRRVHVHVQLNWLPEPEFGGLYEAKESGAYARAGLDVALDGGGPGSPVVQLVASGKADYGVAGADDVITARARGVDVVAIFGTFQTSPQGVMVHEAQAASLDALSSGTLALEPGLPFGMYLRKRFSFAGVKIVPYDGGVARFVADASHAQQCYVTSEPLAAKKQGVATRVFLGADAGFNPYANVLVTRGDKARGEPDAVRAFVRASAEGWRAYLADPSRANGVMGALNRGMDAETFAATAAAQKPLVETDETRADGLGAMREERWTTLGAQLKELGVVPEAPRATDCYADLR